MTLNYIDYNEAIFPIRTAAKLLKVSIPTLRMYENEGLFIPFKNSSNQRMYSKADIDRISLIRKMIKEDKISINGIKNLFSLIPCWEIVNCSLKERKNCKSFNENGFLCWTSKKSNPACKDKNCRECSVYNDFFNCSKIKEYLKGLSKTTT